MIPVDHTSDETLIEQLNPRGGDGAAEGASVRGSDPWLLTATNDPDGYDERTDDDDWFWATGTKAGYVHPDECRPDPEEWAGHTIPETTDPPEAAPVAEHAIPEPGESATPEQLLAAAEGYAALGWQVVPLHDLHAGVCSCGRRGCERSAGKHPRVGNDWGNKASTDPGTIRGWWAKWSHANIGVKVGSESGVVAVDIDGPFGRSKLAELSGGDLPPTVTMTTGNGERELYRIPDGLEAEPRTVYFLGPDGGEAVRLQGGGVKAHQCVMPPSLHYLGKRYRWKPGYGPGEIEPAPMPAWMIAEMYSPPRESPPPRADARANDPTLPGNVFNARADWWEHVLTPAGAKPSGRNGEVQYVCRPGKAGGVSATLGYYKDENGEPLLFNFSGNFAGLPADRKCFDKFGVFARLFHGGDFTKAASAIRKMFPDAFPRNGRPTFNGVREDKPGGGYRTADTGGQTAEGGKAGEEPEFKFYNATEFDDADFKLEWLVTGALVRGQPGAVVGQFKTLKTTLGAALAIALASGAEFLGNFAVHRRTRVVVVSGESGPGTLQETARRISRSYGFAHRDLGEWLYWSTDLPVLNNPPAVRRWADALAAREVEVAILDPFYLMLGGAADPKELFAMGDLLKVVRDTLLSRGITPILVHHANRTLQPGEPMELHHIAYAGVAEFTRQFMLVSRRERYEKDGRHKLWAQIGGSAFGGRLWGLDINEGQSGEDFNGRVWEVEVLDLEDVKGERAAAKAGKKQEEQDGDEFAFMGAVDEETRAGVAALTLPRAMEITGLTRYRLKAAADRCVRKGLAERHTVTKSSGKNGRTQTVCPGWRRPAKDR